MQLELLRIDYNLVGQISKKCLNLLPAQTSSKLQKVVVGDNDGVLQVFGMGRAGGVEIFSKTGPGPPISCMALGGMHGEQQDKIFVSLKNEVRGYTKKGKQFLGFDTNITGNITLIGVSGSDLLVCAGNSYYHYFDCKEVGSHLCGDEIIDVTVITFQQLLRTIVVLCCEDKTLRVFDIGSKSAPQIVPLPSTPSVLHSIPGSDVVLYGTTDAGIGCITFPSRGEINTTWIVEPDQSGSQVTAIFVYDLLGSGAQQLVLGRDDGTVQVRTMPEIHSGSLQQDQESTVLYSECFNESISGVVVGCVSSQNFAEIIVATHSGWIFGLTPETGGGSMAMATDAHHILLSQVAHSKLTALRAEIEQLEDEIHKQREIYQTLSLEYDVMSAIPLIDIKDRFSLNADASYWLSIQVQSSIDNVLIQSDVPIDLLDVPNNSAVVSFSESDPKDGNFLLATYRCQLNTTRLQLKLRTIEGQRGTVRAYITPNIQPKCCQLREYPIRPLSLHTRAHSRDNTRPYNILTLKGAFSLAEMHSWINSCLPEVTEKPPNETPVLHYTSTLVGTVLTLSYRKGEAEFESDNISTISILKDVLSKEVTRSSKKRSIDIAWNINEKSIPHTLALIHPKLSEQLELQRKSNILQALGEIEEEGRNGLTPEFGAILEDETAIMDEINRQPACLDRLCGVLTDLYIDIYKFQGVQVKHRVPELLQLITVRNYSLPALIEFFGAH